MSFRLEGSGVRFSEAEAVVIGGGVAGLTAAALLAADGARVQVLERHTVPGGCASFFQEGGYRFDVGATLVSGFGPRGTHRLLFDRLGIALDAQRVEPAMEVHLAGDTVVRWGDRRWAAERLRAFGPRAEPFWRRQERYANAAWDLSSRFPSLPLDPRAALALLRAMRPRQAVLAGGLGRTVAALVPADAGPKLRAFLDAQLLITAQAGASETDLLYGCTALDLAREGTFHVAGGTAAIAVALARSVRRSGGQIAYATTAARIATEQGAVTGVVLADGTTVRTGRVVAAIPIWDTVRLLGAAGAALGRRAAVLPQRWSAFAAYVGLPPGVLAEGIALHHQVIVDAAAPPGEGNTVFISFSPPGDGVRARGGGRALTMSTHTDPALWERAYRDGEIGALSARYAAAFERALDSIAPGAWRAAELTRLATPHTFARYTGRHRGLVGGIPQTPAFAGLRALGHRAGVAGLALCGDTSFPGQSTVGASLSGVAAARALGAAI